MIKCRDLTRVRWYAPRQDNVELFRQIQWAENYCPAVHLGASEPAHPVNVLISKVNLRLRFEVADADQEAGIGLSVPACHREHAS